MIEYKDVFEWIRSLENIPIRYLIYRRMFTPREMEEKYMDESVYENGTHFTDACIREVIQLPDGDLLLGMQPIFSWDDISNEQKEDSSIEYVKLSEIRLSKFERDQHEENWD